MFSTSFKLQKWVILCTYNIIPKTYEWNTRVHSPIISSSIFVVCASIGVDCQVESTISPGARLHDMWWWMVRIKANHQSTDIFHPPILISNSMSLLLCVVCPSVDCRVSLSFNNMQCIIPVNTNTSMDISNYDRYHMVKCPHRFIDIKCTSISLMGCCVLSSFSHLHNTQQNIN